MPFLGVHAAVSSEADRPETRSVYYDPNEELLSEYDREKLLAFWSIVNEETGVSNGEDCFISEWPTAWLDEIGGSEYGGTAVTPLIMVYTAAMGWYPEGSFDFDLMYELNHLVPIPGSDTGDMMAPVMPELHGELDLSGTKVARFGASWGGPENPTYLTGVCLDDCEELESVYLMYAHCCEEVSALNCPSLNSFTIVNSAVHHIAVTPTGFGKDVDIRAFGQGSVGVRYRNYNDEPTCMLYAYPTDAFLGWYKDGVLISAERNCEVFDGGRYVACYGGDADGSGSITVTDAIMVLRTAMGIGRDGEISEQMMDVNGNGTVDVSDAIMILRFAMGII